MEFRGLESACLFAQVDTPKSQRVGLRGEIPPETFEVGGDCSQSVLNCLDSCYRHPLFVRSLPC